MFCRDLEENQIAEKYLNCQLNEAAQDEFELHILECEHCQSSLELLQSVRDDLISRAHELRTYSPAAPRRVRWTWVTAAALVVLVIACGLLQLRKLQHTAGQTAKLQPASKGGASEPDIVALSSTDKLPVNRQNYLNFTPKAGNAPHEVRPKSTPRDRSTPKLDVAGERGRSNQINIPDLYATTREDLVDYESIDSQENERQNILATLDKLKLPESLAQDREFVAELQYLRNPPKGTRDTIIAADGELTLRDLAIYDALEHLSSVQAPPYTFSGASAVKHSHGTANSVVADVSNGMDLPEVAQSLFHDAMLAYAEKHYAAAEALLQDAIQSAPGWADVNFYLGICRLLGDRANEAVEPLQFVLTKENSPHLQSAHFYLGKAYLQMRDITRAQAQLESAAAMPGRLTGEAKSTLARLRAILVFQSEEKPETINTPDKKN